MLEPRFIIAFILLFIAAILTPVAYFLMGKDLKDRTGIIWEKGFSKKQKLHEFIICIWFMVGGLGFMLLIAG